MRRLDALMQLFAPLYYKEFKCIADKCKHSCCIGWEIDIDSDTLSRYGTGEADYCEAIRRSIEYGDTPHFALSADRCVHLDSDGLCKIIKNLGEGWLSDICREHPRFYNRTCMGLEVGLGLSCEEACRIILTCDGYSEIAAIGEVCDTARGIDYDAVAERARLYAILSDRTVPYGARLEELYSMYGDPRRIIPDGTCRDILSSLEYLDEKNRKRFSVYSSASEVKKEHEELLERFVAYLVYRHASGKRSREEFLAAAVFAFTLERLYASVLSCEGAAVEDAFDVARVISEEIEYSEDNTDVIMSEIEFEM